MRLRSSWPTCSARGRTTRGRWCSARLRWSDSRCLPGRLQHWSRGAPLQHAWLAVLPAGRSPDTTTTPAPPSPTPSNPQAEKKRLADAMRKADARLVGPQAGRGLEDEIMDAVRLVLLYWAVLVLL